MRPPKNSWPSTDGSRGILMFAQQMREMLTPTTFESFRVYSLETSARLIEALLLADDVRKKRVPKAVLEPILAELRWSFSKDSAARALAANEVDSMRRLMDDKNLSLDTFSAHIHLIIKLISVSYKKKLEEIILKIFADKSQRIELRKITGFYCSHLINIGYSRQYIFDIVNTNFFSENIQRVGKSSLSKFFRNFDSKAKKFVVHAGISSDVAAYLRRLSFPIHDLNTLAHGQQATLALNPNANSLPKVAEIKMDALDPHGAMDQCYQLLNAFRAIAYLDPYGMEFAWGDTMHVNRLRSHVGQAIVKTDFLIDRPRSKASPSVWRPRSISKYTRTIIDNFGDASTERLLSSIRTAALARTSLNPENQLISLWSAIEVLLSEPDDDARIVHYADLIVPCIALRHIRRQVISIYDELLISYRTRFNRLLRSMPNYKEMGSHRTFAELMFLPEHESQRLALLDILTANPLALHRVFKLHSDYKDSQSTGRTISDHSNRVRWQIHRIYRTRNQLVHAGQTPSYLESVILNLAEYYRAAIATIVNHAKRESGNSDVDQVVAEIGIRFGIYRRAFEGDQKANLTPTQIMMLIDHPAKSALSKR